jgi:hypothetical protein
MAEPKFQVVSPIGTYKTVMDKNAASARTKGEPELLGDVLVFAFDDYKAGEDHLLVYQASQVLVTSSGANAAAEIEQVNFNTLLARVYWSSLNDNVTTDGSGGKPLCGRVLEKKDLSAARVAGDNLLIEFGPAMA